MSAPVRLSAASASLRRAYEQRSLGLGAGELARRRGVMERDLRRRDVNFLRRPSKRYFRQPADNGPITVDPIPYPVSEPDWDLLARGYAQRLRVFGDLLRELSETDSSVIPAEVRKAHQGGLAALSILAEQPHPVTFVGSDLMLSVDGLPILVEDNVAAAGASVYPVLVNTLASEVMVEFGGGRQAGLGAVGDLVRRVHEELCDTNSAPCMVYTSHGPGDVNFIESALIAEHGGFVLADPEDLAVAPDGTCRLILSDGTRRTVDLVYCNQSAKFELSHRLLEAIPKGKIRVVNHPAVFALNDKYLFRFIPELIRARLGEEPVLAQAETLLMLDEADRRRVLADLGQYVIKPRRGVGGTDVIVTAFASSDEIAAARQRVAADPEIYLAQPRVESSRPLSLGRGGGPPHFTKPVFDVRITGYSAHHQAVNPAPMGRVDVEGKGLVNFSAGGDVKPVHIVRQGSGDAGS